MILGIVKLPPIVRYDYVRNLEAADYVLPYKAGDLGFYDRLYWLSFHPFHEVIDFDNEELVLLPFYREWSHYVDTERKAIERLSVSLAHLVMFGCSRSVGTGHKF